MRHFEHEDSTPFFWLGDTWWMALSRMHWPGDFKELVADRKEKGFNLVQVVAGIFPEFREEDPLPEYAANKMRHFLFCGHRKILAVILNY